MADEAAPKTGASAQGGDAKAPAEAAPEPHGGGKSGGSILPLILTPILCAGAAFGVSFIYFKPLKSKIEAIHAKLDAAIKVNTGDHGDGDNHGKDAKDSHGKDAKDSHGKDAHGKVDPKAKGAAAKGAAAAAEDEPDALIPIGERIVVNPAETGGQRYFVAKISLIRAKKADTEFKARVTKNEDRLKSVTNSRLSSHTVDYLLKVSNRPSLINDLKDEFEEILGKGSIDKVVVSEWIMQ